MKAYFWQYFSILFVIGLVNNLGYVMIGVGAQDIAIHFDEQNLMPLFQFMLVCFNLVVLVVNFRYLVAMNTMLRVTIIAISMGVSFGVMSICSAANGNWGFPIALLATLVMGMSQSWGECINLAFTKSFPSDYVVGFASGTGFAGVAGSGAWLIFRAAGLSNYQVFLIVIPLLIPYWFGFLWVYRQSKKINATNASIPMVTTDDAAKAIGNAISVETGNALFTRAQLPLIWAEAGFWALNLGSVYFLEYCVITGFADRATLKYTNHSNFFKENAFIVIQFCYQIGVLMSRSSLKCFKVRKVWIVTALQTINFCVWWFEAEFLFLSMWGEFVFAIWVGCMGGLSYVNVAYLILNSENLPKEYKEAAVNVSLCFNNIGIVLAALFCLLLDNVIMTN